MRSEPVADADERDMLTGWLDWHRDTLLVKVSDLDAQALARRPIPGSAASLLGLLRHLAEVERTWFRVVHGGQLLEPLPWADDPFGEEDTAEFDAAAKTPAANSIASWRREVDAARLVIAASRSMTDTAASGLPLRFWLGKALQEYARHNGHADILRELIDGTTGE